jgi:hypothetical protein
MPTSISPSAIQLPISPRKMGFEFEVGIPTSISHHELANRIGRELNSQGMQVNCGSRNYGHTTGSNRSVLVKPDGSLHFRRYYGAEVVTPVLQGQETYPVIRAIMKTLNGRTSASVNKTCGYHLHIDVSDYSLTNWKTFLTRYIRAERRIFSTIAPSRFYGHYSVPLFRQLTQELHYTSPTSECVIERYCQEVWDCTSLHSIYRLLGSTRYTAINIEPAATGLRSAIEFRMHQGTLCPDKVIAWAEFWQCFVQNAISGEHRYRPIAENYGNRRAYVAKCVSGELQFQNWAFFNSRRQALKTAHNVAGAEWNLRGRGRGLVQWNSGEGTWAVPNSAIQTGTAPVRRVRANTGNSNNTGNSGADNSAPVSNTGNANTGNSNRTESVITGTMNILRGCCNITPRTDTRYMFDGAGRFLAFNDLRCRYSAGDSRYRIPGRLTIELGVQIAREPDRFVHLEYNAIVNEPMMVIANGIETMGITMPIANAYVNPETNRYAEYNRRSNPRILLIPNFMGTNENSTVESREWSMIALNENFEFTGILMNNIPETAIPILHSARQEMNRIYFRSNNPNMFGFRRIQLSNLTLAR